MIFRFCLDKSKQFDEVVQNFWSHLFFSFHQTKSDKRGKESADLSILEIGQRIH